MSERSQARVDRIAGLFEKPMLVAAVLVIPAIVIEESGLASPWPLVAAALNWAIWIAFAVEFVVLLWLAPGRWRWIRDHPLEVAIVVLTPPFLPGLLQGLRVARLLRLVRVLRLFRAAQLSKRIFSLTGLRWVSVMTVLVVLGGGALFTEVERGTQDLSAWDGLWWALTTATTVAYGDISPKTDGGRAIAIAVMVVSIGFVAMLTAAIAQRFIVHEVEAEIERALSPVEGDEREILAELAEARQRLTSIETRLRDRAQRPQ